MPGPYDPALDPNAFSFGVPHALGPYSAMGATGAYGPTGFYGGGGGPGGAGAAGSWPVVPVSGDGVPVQASVPGTVSSAGPVLKSWSQGAPSAAPRPGAPPAAPPRGEPPAPAPARAAQPAAEPKPRDPLCSASIEYLRAHGVPGKPAGWLERVERELCWPDLAQYDIPICPERQVMKFGTTYTREIEGLASSSASMRESARKTLQRRVDTAPFNRRLLPGPDGVLRRERHCGSILGSRAAGTPAAAAPVEQTTDATSLTIRPETEPPQAGPPGRTAAAVSTSVGTPEAPLPSGPFPTVPGRPQPPTGYRHPPFTLVIPPRPGISRPNEGREVENGGLVWGPPDVRDPGGFLGVLDPSDVDSSGMYSYRPSQGGLPYDPAAVSQDLPTEDSSLMQLRSTSGFRVAFDETGEIWSAYS